MSSEWQKDTGIERLRRIVRCANMTREDAFDGFSPADILRIFEACWSSEWDILPDDLTYEERGHAAMSGRLSDACAARLKERYG